MMCGRTRLIISSSFFASSISLVVFVTTDDVVRIVRTLGGEEVFRYSLYAQIGQA